MVKIILVATDNKVQCVDEKLIDAFDQIKHEYTPEAVEQYNLEHKNEPTRNIISQGEIKADKEPDSRNFGIIADIYKCCMSQGGYKMPENGIDEYFIFSSFQPKDGLNLLASAFVFGTRAYGNLVIYKRHNERLVDMSVEEFETLFLYRLRNKRLTLTSNMDPDSDDEDKQEIEKISTDHLLSGPSVCTLQ